MLMARAGYDPREAIDLSENFQALGDVAPPEFLSTHPSEGTRIERLQKLMPKALEIYRNSGGQSSSAEPDRLSSLSHAHELRGAALDATADGPGSAWQATIPWPFGSAHGTRASRGPIRGRGDALARPAASPSRRMSAPPVTGGWDRFAARRTVAGAISKLGRGVACW